VGSIGDIAAFSFCQDKIMTTAGEGGMVTTNSEELWESVWAYKDHGKSYAAVYARQHAPGYRWLHESFGTNWRMTEVQSAIGRVLLRKLPSWVNTRRKYARLLTKRFENIPELRTTVPPPEVEHSSYKYYVFVRPERLRPGWNRDRLVNAIGDAGVPCFTGSCSEIYLERAFPPDLRPADRLAVARQLGETSLMFLVHPTLTKEAISATADAVEQVLNAAAQR
jgi:dTDP-4-amino-4,6-dideoxygalactose transaminase